MAAPRVPSMRRGSARRAGRGLGWALAQDLGGLASRARGLVAVAQTVDPRHQHTLWQEGDDGEVSARRLAAPAPGGNAPLHRLARGRSGTPAPLLA